MIFRHYCSPQIIKKWFYLVSTVGQPRDDIISVNYSMLRFFSMFRAKRVRINDRGCDSSFRRIVRAYSRVKLHFCQTTRNTISWLKPKRKSFQRWDRETAFVLGFIMTHCLALLFVTHTLPRKQLKTSRIGKTADDGKVKLTLFIQSKACYFRLCLIIPRIIICIKVRTVCNYSCAVFTLIFSHR